jgi:hypothetical protein
MAKYSEKAQDKVEEVMHEQKEGKLKSGSGKKVTDRKQAIAIALSEAREEGATVPPKKSAGRGTTKKTAANSAPEKAAAKKSAPKKAVAKKTAAKKLATKS